MVLLKIDIIYQLNLFQVHNKKTLLIYKRFEAILLLQVKI